jgi:hypothetical protein
MKKKFKLYCGLLIAAIIVTFGIAWAQGGYFAYLIIQESTKQAKKNLNEGVTKEEALAKSREDMRNSFNVTPVELWYSKQTVSTDSIVNLKTGEKMPMEIEMATVYPKDNGKRLKWKIGLSYVCFCLWVIFWIAFFKLIIAVNKGKLFEKSMETQFSWCGWCLMGIYLIGWIGELANHLMNLEMFEFANYNQTLGSNAPDSIYLYSAIGLLLIGQIFKIARQMKEEQELTI